MDPEEARRLRQWPSLALMLQTADGGKSWKTTVSSLMGRLTRFCYVSRGPALTLFEFDYTFEWPSEVYRINVGDTGSTRAFREADRAITDIALLPSGVAYLAGFEPPGTMRQLPIPGKVRIIRSADLKQWQDMEVDYRATARRVHLATRPEGPALAATDTGVILLLQPR
jgi:hypothetical protein